MLAYEKEIRDIYRQIEERFHPQEVILFGSCARGAITNRSDVDICVIAETDNKRVLVQRILMEIEYERDLDVIVYTPVEWQKYVNDTSTFAYKIDTTGVKINGRY